MGADSGAHDAVEQQQQQQQQQAGLLHMQPRSLSVHWAEALEQHAQRPHTPAHTHFAPDKPCLKAQQSRFPFVEEEAVAAGGGLHHPSALLAQLNGDVSAAAPAAKKRSRMAAFGQ